jgi:hypothetical protein
LDGAWHAHHLRNFSRAVIAWTTTDAVTPKIRRAVVRADGQMIVGLPKSDAGIRDVAIPPHLLPPVKGHLQDFTSAGKDALLFPAADNSDLHMAPSTLYKVYCPARRAAGREDLRWHDLRHTGAVLAAQTGATLAELMGRLGPRAPFHALPARRSRSGRRDREAALRDVGVLRTVAERPGTDRPVVGECRQHVLDERLVLIPAWRQDTRDAEDRDFRDARLLQRDCE